MFKKIKEGFLLHPIQNSSILASFLLIGFIFYNSFYGKITSVTNKKEATNNKTSLLVLKDNPDNFFVTGENQENTTASSDSALSSSTNKDNNGTTIATITGDESQLGDLDSDLYQYTSASLSNASAGIREINALSKSNSLSEKAFAASRKYPAVYTVGGNTSEYNKVYEMNVYTGEKKTVIEEPEGSLIRSVDFNQKSQAIVYPIVAKEDQDPRASAYPYSIKVKYLDTNETIIIGTNKYAASYAKWSQNGKNILVGVEGRGDNGYHSAISASIFFWNADTKQSKECAANRSAEGLPDKLLWPRYTYWADNGDSAISITDAPGNSVLIGNRWEHKQVPVIIKKSDCSWQLVEMADSARDTHTGGPVNYPLKIDNKILSFNYDINQYRAKSSENNFSSWGWIAIHDISNNSEVSYKDQMGEWLSNWIVDKSLSKIVYTVTPSNAAMNSPADIKLFDISSGEVKSLLSPSTYYQVVGWNGNENNVLLWDVSDNFYNLNVKTNKLNKLTRK